MARDLIVGRAGDTVTGKVQEPAFHIETELGTLEPKTPSINRIHFKDGVNFPEDQIWLKNSDQLTGRVVGKEVHFKTDGGAQLIIATRLINSVLIDWLVAAKADPLPK
jgi:hypothetical protein